MAHFLVFGNHPRLSLAEYRAIRPDMNTPPRLMAHGAVVEQDAEWDGQQLMDQLGGTVKLGDIVLSCPAAELDAERLAEICVEHPRQSGDAEIAFGCSAIGGTPGVRRALEKLPLHVKRALKERGIRSRWVTSKESPALTPAAVAKLKLTTHGYDFVLLADGQTIHVGLTTHVQNADAWSNRDYGRPIRDDENGMLPPKLARIMLNLARVKKDQIIFDPFCGSGTMLMEAALGCAAGEIIGSDLEAKQVASSEQNTNWLVAQQILTQKDRERIRTFTSDVRSVQSHLQNTVIDRVITEGSLGPPLRGGESQKQLDQNREFIEKLWKDALKALHPLLAPDAVLVMCWPSFKTSHGLARVKLDDDLATLGYRIVNPLAGWDETGAPLVYHREGQKIARRIAIIAKA